MNTYKLHN